MTQQAIDEITLTGVNNRLLSLNHGLMGKALFFYKYAWLQSETHYGEYAENLVHEIFENVSKNMSIGFMDGLAGIGWCIQYLLSKQLEEGEDNDILVDLDNAIMEHDPMRI